MEPEHLLCFQTVREREGDRRHGPEADGAPLRGGSIQRAQRLQVNTVVPHGHTSHLSPCVLRLSVSSPAAAAAALAQGEADQHHSGLGGRAARQGLEQSRRRLQVRVALCSSVTRIHFLCCKKMRCQSNE